MAVADHVSAECVRRGETWIRSWVDYMHALAALSLGRPGEAAALARTAIAGKRHFNDITGIAMAVDLLASVAIAAGQAGHAARLLGVAEQIWHAVGALQASVPGLIAAREACETQARGLIGDDAYKIAFHTGYDADLDAGIAYALTPPTAS